MRDVRLRLARPLADLAPGARVVVALSGGRDSAALLDCLHHHAAELQISLSALHIHHGLQAAADEFARVSEQLCALRRVALRIEHVNVERGAQLSTEAQARRARRAAFAALTDADVIALAQHADDQIETHLLQLLRGAGLEGLAAMPRWSAPLPNGAVLWRPWLEMPRSEIDAYVAEHRIVYVDDPTNADLAIKRNALRRTVLPALEAHFPQYRQPMLRSIAHLQSALQMQQRFSTATGELNARSKIPQALPLASLAGDEDPAMLALRNWLRGFGVPLPPARRQVEWLRQLRSYKRGQAIDFAFSDMRLCVVDGALCTLPPVSNFDVPWQGEPLLTTPMGSVSFHRIVGGELALDGLSGLRLRASLPGDHIQLGPRQPRRGLARLWQSLGVDTPLRRRLPVLVDSTDRVLWAACAGSDVGASNADSKAVGWRLKWLLFNRSRD